VTQNVHKCERLGLKVSSHIQHDNNIRFMMKMYNTVTGNKEISMTVPHYSTRPHCKYAQPVVCHVIMWKDP